MKITLKNFRCWENNTFELPDNQLTLISGPSGNGKSTILMAIHFALYGSNNKYLISHNKTSCEVVMETSLGDSRTDVLNGGAVDRDLPSGQTVFKVKRTKRPNILNVWVNGRLFEDEEAQVVIDRHFGQSSVFCNFLDMSISDKSHFLEKIINSTYNINELKDTLKKDIFNVNKDLTTIEGQLSTATEMCKIITKPHKVEKPTKPEGLLLNASPGLRVEVSNAIQQALVDQRTTFGLLQQKLALQPATVEYPLWGVPLERLESQIREAESDLSAARAAEQKCAVQEERAKMARASLARQEREVATLADASAEGVQTLQTQLEQADEQLQAELSLLPIYKIQQLRTKYNETLQKEIETWQKNIKDLENNLNGQIRPQTLDEDFLTECLYKYKEAANFLKRVYKEELLVGDDAAGELRSRIGALKRTFFKPMNCPNCLAALTLDMNTHTFVEACPSSRVEACPSSGTVQVAQLPGQAGLDATLRELRRLEALVEKCVAARTVVDSVDVEETRSNLQDARTHNRWRAKLDELREFRPSPTLRELQRALPPFTNDQHVFTDPADTIDALKEAKADLKTRLGVLTSRRGQRGVLERAIRESREHISAYDCAEHARVSARVAQLSASLAQLKDAKHVAAASRKAAVAIARLDCEIAKIGFDEGKLLELNAELDKLNRFKKYEDDLGLYSEFIKSLRKYKKAKETLINLSVSKSAKTDHYNKLLVFRKHVGDAEAESLNSVVLSVNAHLQMFLDDFFSEDCGEPIQVYLETINDKKPQINTIINYKGNLVDFKSLSAGEGARVKLAFDLTFKEILNEHIIMLDECTANLDQDLTTKVCKKIKNTFPCKTILLVAHQVVAGLFDNNIQL